MATNVTARIALALALGALLSAPALADDPKGPPPDLQRLQKLEGPWTSEVRARLDGKSYLITYNIAFHPTKDGSGLTMTERFDSAELGAFRGENLIGYDPFTRKIRWFSVDNMGTAHEHVGAWASPTRFAMEHHGRRDGKAYVERLTMDVRGPDRLDIRLVGTLGGKVTQDLVGTFHRGEATLRSSR